jgi:hypothetical protein
MLSLRSNVQDVRELRPWLDERFPGPKRLPKSLEGLWNSARALLTDDLAGRNATARPAVKKTHSFTGIVGTLWGGGAESVRPENSGAVAAVDTVPAPSRITNRPGRSHSSSALVDPSHEQQARVVERGSSSGHVARSSEGRPKLGANTTQTTGKCARCVNFTHHHNAAAGLARDGTRGDAWRANEGTSLLSAESIPGFLSQGTAAGSTGAEPKGDAVDGPSATER